MMPRMPWVGCDDGQLHLLQKLHRDRDGTTIVSACGLAYGASIEPVTRVCPRCAGLAMPIE